jgi:hypothetical protein
MRTDHTRERQELMNWHEKVVACVESLPPDERGAFDKWDSERTGDVNTSEWPGFSKYLPPRPHRTGQSKLARATRLAYCPSRFPSRVCVQSPASGM